MQQLRARFVEARSDGLKIRCPNSWVSAVGASRHWQPNWPNGRMAFGALLLCEDFNILTNRYLEHHEARDAAQITQLIQKAVDRS